jgi:hypothetical protein
MAFGIAESGVYWPRLVPFAADPRLIVMARPKVACNPRLDYPRGLQPTVLLRGRRAENTGHTGRLYGIVVTEIHYGVSLSGNDIGQVGAVGLCFRAGKQYGSRYGAEGGSCWREACYRKTRCHGGCER